MIVRPERESDHEAVAALVEAAFGSRAHAELVEALRASSGYVPELALVAELDDGVVGHVMLTLTQVEAGDDLLMLSPLAVRPDRQRRGVGTALVEAALERARQRDEAVVIVEGDPRYYARFGFDAASTFGLDPPHESIPAPAFQALVLGENHPRGRVAYPPAFDPFYK